MQRITHAETMMAMAITQSLRSTCLRRAVGAVITDVNGRVISTGYNGPPKDAEHCIDKPCPGVNAEQGQGLDICRAIHAEQNAVASMSDYVRGHTIYVTTQPCMACTKLLLCTGITTIIYMDDYYNGASKEIWLEANRSLIKFDASESSILTKLRLESYERLAGFKRSASLRA